MSAFILPHPAVNGIVLYPHDSSSTSSYATLAAAKAAAASGDTIVVGPGAYSISASLAKDGVNWFFYPGASTTFADDVSTEGIWDDGGTAMSFTVGGYGVFSRTTTDDFLEFKTVNCSHASSQINVACDTINTQAGSDGPCAGVLCSAGELNVEAINIISTGGNTYANWWLNGQMNVHAKFCSAEYVTFASNVTATPTGDAHFDCDQIEGIVGSDGTDSTAAAWVRCNILLGNASASISTSNNSRLYVEAQKVFGPFNFTGGLNYVRSDKISAVANGGSSSPSLIKCTGGTSFVQINQYDPVSFTGQSIKVTGGTLKLFGGDFVGASGTDGLEITGGTADVREMVINTAASSSDNPVTKSGGTLIMRGCTLVSQGARNTIEAATAQTVSLMGCWGNNALDGDVTNNITSGYLTDSDVT